MKKETNFTWEQLVKDLTNIAKHKGASYTDANDYAQETCLSLIGRIKEDMEYKSIKSYASRMMSFIIKDEWKRTNATLGKGADILPNATPDGRTIIDLIAVEDERLEHVEAEFVLDRLYLNGSKLMQDFIDSYRTNPKHGTLIRNKRKAKVVFNVTECNLNNVIDVVRNNI